MPTPALTLPAITSETIEVPLTSWATGVDPTTLTWRSAVSATANRDTHAAPPVTSADWRPTTCVTRTGTLGTRHVVLVPVDALPAGTYGVWVRVAGAALASPARWAGQLILR